MSLERMSAEDLTEMYAREHKDSLTRAHLREQIDRNLRAQSVLLEYVRRDLHPVEMGRAFRALIATCKQGYQLDIEWVMFLFRNQKLDRWQASLDPSVLGAEADVNMLEQIYANRVNRGTADRVMQTRDQEIRAGK